MRPSVFLLILLTTLFPCLAGHSAKDPADYVNPFIGAGSMEGLYKNSFHGKNFPGAATPNGMVQLSPDTITGGTTAAAIRMSIQRCRDSALTT